ncbi:MAG: hypothetical protein M3Y74_02890 [Chloroflexota bacterium]|nr:hypothetical protein [Chloroflexota bacterium]
MYDERSGDVEQRVPDTQPSQSLPVWRRILALACSGVALVLLSAVTVTMYQIASNTNASADAGARDDAGALVIFLAWSATMILVGACGACALGLVRRGSSIGLWLIASFLACVALYALSFGLAAARDPLHLGAVADSPIVLLVILGLIDSAILYCGWRLIACPAPRVPSV